MKFTYSLIRFVPDPARGEFVNVALLVGDEATGKMVLKISPNKRRPEHIASPKLIGSFFEYLTDLKREIESERAKAVFSSSWLSSRIEKSNNLLQFSAPSPVSAAEIDQAANMLFKELLKGTLRQKRRRGPTKTTVVTDLRRSLAGVGLVPGKDFFERVDVTTSKYKERFDFGVKNGKLVQLANAWNFEQRDLEPLLESIKATAFTLEEIRTNGGQAILAKKSVRVPSDIEVQAVYIKPKTNQGKDALEEALSAFKKVDAIAIPATDASDFGTHAAELLA